MGKRIEIQAGAVFNKLTYLYDTENVGHNRMGVFECECGSKKSLPFHSVYRGIYKSCGCDHHVITHGHCQRGNISSLHRRWGMMKYRCNNPRSKDYPRYGGRGITVCPEWLDFEVFAKWAYDNGYSEKLTLDRKENDKGYYPGNCRWVSQFTQQANKSKKPKLMFDHIGVRRLPSGNWHVLITHQNTNIQLGTYPTEREAVEARNNYIQTNGLPHTKGEIT